MKIFDSPAYRRSRGAYMAQCTVEYFVSLLVTDAFLAKLLSYIGISDALIGIISSFITLAFVIQLLSIFLVKKITNTKMLVIALDTASIFFFMLLFFVPFLSQDKGIRTVLVILCVLLAYIGKYLILSVCFKWANSFVKPTKRGLFSARKEMISLVGGMIFTAVTGHIIDKFESLNNLEGAFLFLGISILILNGCNFFCLSLIKRSVPKEQADANAPLSVIAKNTLGNKGFRNVIVLTVLWDVARYFSIGFMGVFKTSDLMLSVFLVQLINILSNLARMIITSPLGKYSDKNSYVKGFNLGLYLAAVAFFINIFTSNSTWFLIIPFTLLYNCSFAGTNQNSFNISYNYVDARYITQAMAFKNSIGGLFGFGASILGSKIVSLVQANGNQIFGLPVYGQQLLSAISFIIIVVAIVFVKKVIEKQEIIIQ